MAVFLAAVAGILPEERFYGVSGQLAEGGRSRTEKHPTLYYNLARAYSLTGDKTEAVKWLEKTLELGFGAEALDGGDFQFLLNSPEYAALRRRIESVKKPMVKSRIAATVSERDLIPEGIAFDAATEIFILAASIKEKS